MDSLMMDMEGEEPEEEDKEAEVKKPVVSKEDEAKKALLAKKLSKFGTKMEVIQFFIN